MDGKDIALGPRSDQKVQKKGPKAEGRKPRSRIGKWMSWLWMAAARGPLTL